MEIGLFVVIVVLLVVIAWRLFMVQKPKQDDQSLILLQNQMQAEQKQLHDRLGELTKMLDVRLGDSTKTMLAQSDKSVQIVREITSEITKVQEGQKQMVTLNDQLKNLNDILKNTKQRGILGEYYLEMVLKNVLSPGEYQLQYPFKDNTKVDAVIFYDSRVIPIDSKFSLENYNRLAGATSDEERKRYEDAFRNDLKTRIDETAKYQAGRRHGELCLHVHPIRSPLLRPSRKQSGLRGRARSYPICRGKTRLPRFAHHVLCLPPNGAPGTSPDGDQ